MLWGMPLVHVAIGIDPVTGRKRVARGMVAVGNVAVGVLAVGGIAAGGMTIGGVSIGLISLGGVAIGLLAALGGSAIGSIALGGAALGFVAVGGAACGYYACGGAAAGVVATGGNVANPAAAAMFTAWARYELWWLVGTVLALPVFILLSVGVLRLQDKKCGVPPPPGLAAVVKASLLVAVLVSGVVTLSPETMDLPANGAATGKRIEVGAFDPWLTIETSIDGDQRHYRQQVHWFSTSMLSLAALMLSGCVLLRITGGK